MVPNDIKQWIRSELFDLVPMNIAMIDRGFKIVEANRGFTETYGEWRDRFCYEAYKGRKDRCERCGAAQTFQDGKIRVREEMGKVHKGKQTYYIVHLVPFKLESGDIPYILEMSTDITAMKMLEREKLEVERLAAVGETVAGLAHGIKNIIMGLEGGMYVVNSGIKRNDAEKIMQGWQMLEEDIGRISSFVKQFLEFARGRTPHVSLIDPNEVVRKVVDLYATTAGLSGIELESNLQQGLEPAPFDEEGLHTCLANLVSNALDACEMSQKRNCDCHVTVSTRERDGLLVFEVADNGCGMDYDIKQKVFTNFFSTKGSGEGTGLGLLTTRKIVQEHGGRVSFDSAEGEGSVFRLEFSRSRLPRLVEESKD